jgi:hypothetical protein
MTCSVIGCERPHRSRGLCSMHYQRLTSTGEIGPASPLPRTGAGNSNWRGGRAKGGHDGRYIFRYAPDHPRARKNHVLEHRLVVEERLGRLLHDDEIVHHVNGDTHDNRIENLKVMTQAEHAREHFTKADA